MSEAGPTPRRPGGQLASRPLHFIWLVDASGSMRVRGKMQAFNQAIRRATPLMQAVAQQNPQATIFVNAICFGDEARWMVERLTPVSEFRWQDLEADGLTALGEALTMIGDALQPPLIHDRSLPPILALVTDGLPTDDFQAGLSHLLARPWGRRAMRLVIALGEDATIPEAQEIFRAFLANSGQAPYQANNAEALAWYVRWISTAILKSVCSPALVDSPRAGDRSNLALPFAAEALSLADDSDEW